MTKNVAQSVRDRLLKLSKERREEYNFVLVRYGLERLLYRLAQSAHADQFVLKGGDDVHGLVGTPASSNQRP